MLSIIIPHYHEHPQLLFTIQSLIVELECNGICYEIILIDNASTSQHEHIELDSVRYINKKKQEGCLDKVVLLEYTDTLSHWQAKNLGIEHAQGDLLLFLDAHVIISPGAIPEMLRSFNELPEHSSYHLPIIYMLGNKEDALIYKLVSDLDKGIVDYAFTKVSTEAFRIEVPCMSTCGMMISKETMLNKFKGWPSSLGNYSGGEHYINFVGAVLGTRKFVLNQGAIYHYAAPRAYDIVYEDVYTNRAIATYLFGGEELLDRYLSKLSRVRRGRVSQRVVNKMRVAIPNYPEHQELKQYIEDNRIRSIKDWIQEWSNHV